MNTLRIFPTGVLVLIQGIILAGCSATTDIPRENVLLATIPDGVKEYGITFSTDGNVVSYIDRTRDSHRIITNGKPGKPVGFL